MKTELKDCLHHYLNTGLKVTFTDMFGEINVGKLDSYDSNMGCGVDDYYLDITPHFLPMSALTDPLEDGTTPIVELAKIAYPKTGQDAEFFDGRCYVAPNHNYYFSYEVSDNSFHCTWYDRSKCYVPNQLALFEYLFSKHFNVFDLDESLWIDKRTDKL